MKKIVRKAGRVKGFALIEVPMVATLKGGRAGSLQVQQGLASERAALLNALHQPSESGNIGPITRPFTGDISWPARTVIISAKRIHRLFGLSATREFQVFVELEAPGFDELIKAFEYLEHYCGVEGYGGG